MKKATPILCIALVTLVLLASCSEAFYQYTDTYVSNMGTVSSSTVDGVTTVTVHFDQAETNQTVDRQSRKIIQTKDTGRYDTLVKVFSDFGLTDGKVYRCTVSVGSEVNRMDRVGEYFNFYYGSEDRYKLGEHSYIQAMSEEFTITISFGGETIIDYSNLPISPVGLEPGTLWNDNGTLRIV